MSTRQQIKLAVGVENQVGAGLKAALTDITKWNAEATRKLVLRIAVDGRGAAKQASDEWLSAITKIQSQMKKFSFDGIFASKHFAKLTPTKLAFSEGLIKNLDFQSATDALKQLKDLQSRLNTGHAVANNWTKNEEKNLRSLITLLEQATTSYRRLKREESYLMGKDSWMMNPLNQQYYAARYENQLAIHKSQMNKQQQKALVADQKLSFLNKEISDWKKLSEGGNVQQQIEANRQLSQLLNRRYQLTKQIADLEESRRFGTRARMQAEGLRQENRRLAERARLTERVNGYFERQSGILGRLRSQLAMYFSIYGIINFGRKLVETTGYFEQQKVALEGITSSAADANKVLNQIKDFALRSPFETKDLIGFTKQLSAFSVPTDELFETTKRLADISAGLGVDMGRIVLAYGQVRSAAVLRGQELRQFTEAGIPMVAKLRDKLEELRGEYVSTGEVFEAISKRQVSFEMVNEVLMNMTKEGGQFYKMQENITDTLYGQTQKLKDMWTLAMQDMGSSSSSVLNKIVKGAQLVVSHLNEIVQIILGVVVGRAIAGIIHGIGNIIRVVKNLQRAITLLSFTNALSVAAVALSTFVGIIVAATSKANALKKKFDEIDASIQKNTSNMTNGANRLLNKLKELNGTTKDFADTLDTLKSNYGEFVTDDVIRALEAEKQGVEKNAQAYENLASQIEAAILARNKYMSNDQKKEAAAGEVSKFINKMNNFWGGIFGGDAKLAKNRMLYNPQQTFNAGTNSYEYLPTVQYKLSAAGLDKDSFEKKFQDALSSAWSIFSQGDDLSFDSFSRKLQTSLTTEMPKFVDNNADKIGGIVQRAWDELSSREDFQETIRFFNENYNSTIERAKRAFGSVRPGDIVATGKTSQQIDNERSILYINALVNGLNDQFDGLSIKKTTAWTDAIGKINEEAKHFDSESIYEVNKALSSLIGTISNGTWMNYVIEYQKQFNNFVQSISGRAAIVRDLGLNNIAYSQNKNVSSLFKTYITDLTNENYDTLREGLKKEYDSVSSELSSYLTKTEKDADDIAKLQDRVDFLKMIAGASFFNVDLTSKKGSGKKSTGEKLDGALGYITKMYDLIKEARMEQEKLVEGTDGYTAALRTSIDTLEDSPLAMFYKDGNPYKEILDEMKKANVAGVIKPEQFDSLENAFTNVEDLSVADFRKNWDNLTDVIRTIADSIKDPDLKARLQNYANGKMIERKKEFDANEIDARIQEAIVSLTRIERDTELIAKKSDLVEQLGSKIGLRAASELINGKGYIRNNGIEDRANMLLSMLQTTGGSGIADKFGYGLNSLLSGAQLGIESLPAIFSLIKQMQDFADKGKVKDAMGNLVDVPEQMQKSIKVFIDGLTELGNLIKAETERNADLFSSDKKKRIEIENAVDVYNNEIDTISKDIYNIDKWTAGYEALQRLFGKVSSAVGVSELPSWATTLSGSNSGTGVSSRGMSLSRYLEGGNLFNVLASAKLQSKYESGEKELTEEEIKSLRKLAARIEMASRIVSKVGSVISNMGEAITAVYDLMDATNGLQFKDGVAYSRNTEAARQGLATFTEFGSGLVGTAEAFLNGNWGTAIVKAFSSVVGLFKNIAKTHDAILKDEINMLEVDRQILENRMEEHDWLQEFRAGYDNIIGKYEKVNMLLEEERKIREEMSKVEQLKEGDADKYNSLSKEANSTYREAVSLMEEIKTSILGTADDLASRLSDAFVQAFRNGENAARSWRDAVKTYIGDALANMFITQTLAPKLQDIMNEYFYGKDSSGNILNSDTAKGFYGKNTEAALKELHKNPNQVKNLEKNLDKLLAEELDEYSALAQIIQDRIGYKSDSASLGGGIKSITEETAGRLEALANSQLGELYQIDTRIATIQGDIALTRSDVRAIKTAFESVMSNGGANRIRVTMD